MTGPREDLAETARWERDKEPDPDVCPTCGCPLPDPRHIVDQANRTHHARQENKP